MNETQKIIYESLLTKFNRAYNDKLGDLEAEIRGELVKIGYDFTVVVTLSVIGHPPPPDDL